MRVQDACGIKPALPAADHDYLFSAKNAKVFMVRRVGDVRFRQPFELWRKVGKWGDACGHDHATCLRALTVVQCDIKSAAVSFHGDHLAALHLGNGILLKPQAIVDETFQRDGEHKLLTGIGFEVVEREFLVWIGNVRCRPVRSHKHPSRHVLLPEAQGIAENRDAAATVLQIGRAREPVGTRSHNDGIEIHVCSILPYDLQMA